MSKKERPYIRKVVKKSKPGHKPKIRVVVVTDKGTRSHTFSFVSWSDADMIAEMFLNAVKMKG